jgi:hypothetical protein
MTIRGHAFATRKNVAYVGSTPFAEPEVSKLTLTASRLAGYEDLNDAERLSQDPTFRLIGSEKVRDRGAALPSRLHWLETEVLTQAENLRGLATMNRELIAKAERQEWTWLAVLDMDTTEVPVYGGQEQSAYNKHYESTCYHSLLPFNSAGDCVAARLRLGNVHSADSWGVASSAGDRTATEAGQGGLRCRFCEARHLRSIGGAWCEVCDSDSGQ